MNGGQTLYTDRTFIQSRTNNFIFITKLPTFIWMCGRIYLWIENDFEYATIICHPNNTKKKLVRIHVKSTSRCLPSSQIHTPYVMYVRIKGPNENQNKYKICDYSLVCVQHVREQKIWS